MSVISFCRKLGGTIDVIGGQTGAIRRVEGRRREMQEQNPIQVNLFTHSVILCDEVKDNCRLRRVRYTPTPIVLHHSMFSTTLQVLGDHGNKVQPLVPPAGPPLPLPMGMPPPHFLHPPPPVSGMPPPLHPPGKVSFFIQNMNESIPNT